MTKEEAVDAIKKIRDQQSELMDIENIFDLLHPNIFKLFNDTGEVISALEKYIMEEK
jgi:hypothetical protein